MSNYGVSKTRKVRVGLYTIGNRNTPSTWFRILQYLPALKNRNFEVTCFMLPAPGKTRGSQIAKTVLQVFIRFMQLLLLKRFDVVLIQKGLTQWRCRGLMKMLLSSKVPYIFDVDDMIYRENPILLPASLRWLQDDDEPLKLTRNAFRVTVGNPYLGDYAGKYNARVSVIPTSVDTDFYKLGPRNPARQKVIGWTGSASTNGYVNMLIPALGELARKCQFRFLIISSGLQGIAVDKMRNIQWSFLRWSRAAEAENLREIDIGVMPLEANEWAMGKCGTKVLLYMAFGIPSVSSAVGPGNEIIEDGVTGFLARDQKEWAEKLELLLSDDSMRRRMGTEARKVVEERYSIRSNVSKLETVFREIA